MALPLITVIGLVQKKETRQTQSGKSITTLNVSCGEKNSKGEFDNLYIKADFWEKQSDFVSQYFNEGDTIIVTGKLVTTNYTKQDGTKVYETKFQFPQSSFVPKPKNNQDNGTQNNHTQPQQTQTAPQVPEIDIESDQIPFNQGKA